MMTRFEEEDLRRIVREEIALDEMRKIEKERKISIFPITSDMLPPRDGALAMVSKSPIYIGMDLAKSYSE